MTTVMVFGTFDGIHPGHASFLRQAYDLGDRVVLALAPDQVVLQLKKHKPVISEQERLKNVKQFVDKAILGDSEIGEFQSVQQHNPDIIALGYDQDQLEQKLTEWIKKTGVKIKVEKLKPHKPEKYKSSKLNYA